MSGFMHLLVTVIMFFAEKPTTVEFVQKSEVSYTSESLLAKQMGWVGKTIKTETHYWIVGDKVRFEQEIHDPQRGNKIAIIADGWSVTYYTGLKKGVRNRYDADPIRPSTLSDPRTMLDEYVRKGAKKAGTEKLDKIPCDVYSLEEKDDSRQITTKIWFDRKYKVVIQLVRSLPGQTSTIRHSDIKTNVTISDELFRAPKGITWVERL